MIKAVLVVQSLALTLAEVSEAMGQQPDEGYDKGSLAAVRQAPRNWTLWSMELAWPHTAHGGTEGLSSAIESLGQPLAERAAKLASQGCDVLVSIHQEVTGAPESVGLHLTSRAIEWMAVAGAALDVDQYVDIGPDAH
jgi:hypothetical protein